MQMEVHSLVYPHQLTKDEQPNTVAAFGFFDGVHQGHRTVIKKAITIAAESNKNQLLLPLILIHLLYYKIRRKPFAILHR